jgi:exodeoxyribonuclease V beta subunit
MTRAKHHVSLVLALDAVKDGPAAISTPSGNAIGNIQEDHVVNLSDLQSPSPYAVDGTGGASISLEIADITSHVQQTYRRTSFTGITQSREGIIGSYVVAPGSGSDETTNTVLQFPQYAPLSAPLGANMPLARVPGGTYLGKVMHKVYELLNFAAPDLQAEVERVVANVVTGHTLVPHRTAIADAIVASLTTSLGPAMENRSLSTFGNNDRLAEMDFEMGLATLTNGVQVSDIGKVLVAALPANNILAPYASVLAGDSFNIPLAGLINGSIDALLRINTADGPRLFITDYKTNRLDSEDDAQVIDAYAPNRLVHAMEHHHYPLQALIYGTAVYRWLKWRAPHVDAEKAVAGVTYFFVRGMVGVDAPRDENGQPYGVFSWTPPAGLWAALSSAMNGGLT